MRRLHLVHALCALCCAAPPAAVQNVLRGRGARRPAAQAKQAKKQAVQNQPPRQNCCPFRRFDRDEAAEAARALDVKRRAHTQCAPPAPPPAAHDGCPSAEVRRSSGWRAARRSSRRASSPARRTTEACACTIGLTARTCCALLSSSPAAAGRTLARRPRRSDLRSSRLRAAITTPRRCGAIGGPSSGTRQARAAARSARSMRRHTPCAAPALERTSSSFRCSTTARSCSPCSSQAGSTARCLSSASNSSSRRPARVSRAAAAPTPRATTRALAATHCYLTARCGSS